MSNPSISNEERLDRTGKLLRQAGYEGPFALVPLAGGANNQVFRVDCGNAQLLLKVYFSHPADSRDRLSADYQFSQFAWKQGVRALARPVLCDVAGKLALYEWIAGAKLMPGEVNWPVVQEALDFYLAINHCRGAEEGQRLPLAAEACFTLKDHFCCVERRVQRLQTIEAASPLDEHALALIQEHLVPLAGNVLHRVEELTRGLGAKVETLAAGDRRLSPSDFGFHNALGTPDGRIKFIDFEYAGWDDPAKMVADFFCQPECPVPPEFFDRFAATVARDLSSPEAHLLRFRLLSPVYRLKWCCIMLNEFLPAGKERRRFARGNVEQTERKAQQLEKVRAALQQVLPREDWLEAA